MIVYIDFRALSSLATLTTLAVLSTLSVWKACKSPPSVPAIAVSIISTMDMVTTAPSSQFILSRRYLVSPTAIILLNLSTMKIDVKRVEEASKSSIVC